MSGLIGVYGASGCGRGILPIFRKTHSDARLVFIDDGLAPGSTNGHTIVSWDAFLNEPESFKSVCIAVAASSVRETLAKKCIVAGVPFAEARAQTVVEMDDVTIGEGACLSPFVTFTSNIRIGKCFHANLYSYVEHDCVIGDFVTLAPGAKINGNVTIGDHAYIGSGAVVRQGVTIGADATVGMGAVVTRDVEPDTTVVGNPAKPLVKS